MVYPTTEDLWDTENGPTTYDEVNERFGVGTATPTKVIHGAGTSTTRLDGLATENLSTASNTTKAPSIAFIGRDTVNTRKDVGYIVCVPNDVNWSATATPNAGGFQFHPEVADAAPAVKMMLTNAGCLGLNTTTFGTSAAGSLNLGNGTEPSSSQADQVALYSVDLSAGNATLGLRTETAVVTETVTSDRTLSVRINGTTYKICLKS